MLIHCSHTLTATVLFPFLVAFLVAPHVVDALNWAFSCVRVMYDLYGYPVPYICGVVRENWLYAQDHVASDAIVVDLDHNRMKLGYDTKTIPSPPSRKWNKLFVTLQASLGNVFERAHGQDNHVSDGRNKTVTNNNASSRRKRRVRESQVWTEKLGSWDNAFILAYSPDSELMDDFTSQSAEYGSNGQTQWDKVQESFLRFFVSLFKDYRRYLTMPSPSTADGGGATTATRPSYDIVGFLRSQTQNSLPFMQGTWQMEIWKSTKLHSAWMTEHLCCFVPGAMLRVLVHLHRRCLMFYIYPE